MRAPASTMSRRCSARISPAIVDAEEIDTLGGLITSLAGHVPVRGEIIVEAGLEFEVLDADPRRVKRIRIRRAALPDDADRASRGRRRSIARPNMRLHAKTRALATRGKSR